MKLSKKPKNDSIMPEKWMCFDGCPVCRLFKGAAESGREITEKEIEQAFSDAEEEAVD